MTPRHWKNGVKAIGFGLVALVGTASAQNTTKDVPGPIDSLQDLQDSGRMLFKLIDENNDGQISQKEAVDAGNLAVGGLFFRADANGDGVVSQEEARAARDSMLAQKPMVRFLIARAQAAKPAAGVAAAAAGTPSPATVFMGLVDANGDRQLQAAEVRQAIQTAVQGAFAAADTNRDGQMSPVEVNAAIIGAARAAQQASFQAADANRDGQLSKDEFNKSLTDPANAAFSILDANNDGQLSPQELQSALRIIQSQIQKSVLPESPNSLRNLINNPGQRPDQISPVPNLGGQARPGAAAVPATGTVPAAGTVPATAPAGIPPR